MGFDELAPAHATLTAFRRGIDVMAAQDIAHGDFVDVMTQISQSALDAAIAPGCIVFRDANHELIDLLINAWSTRCFPLLTAVKLVGNQPLVPSYKGVGGDNGVSVFELLAAQRMSQPGQSASFSIRKAHSTSRDFGLEDLVFFFEIGNDVLLMPVDPACNGDDQGL